MEDSRRNRRRPRCRREPAHGAFRRRDLREELRSLTVRQRRVDAWAITVTTTCSTYTNFPVSDENTPAPRLRPFLGAAATDNCLTAPSVSGNDPTPH